MDIHILETVIFFKSLKINAQKYKWNHRICLLHHDWPLRSVEWLVLQSYPSRTLALWRFFRPAGFRPPGQYQTAQGHRPSVWPLGKWLAPGLLLAHDLQHSINSLTVHVYGCFIVFKAHECVLYLVFTLITPPAWSVAPTSIDLQLLGLLHQFWDPVSGLPNKHSCRQGHASLTCCTKSCTHQLIKNQTSYCYSRLLRSPNRSNIRFYLTKIQSADKHNT